MAEYHPRQAKLAKPQKSRRPAPVGGSPPDFKDFLVVGIGASAGGLEACQKFVSALPAETGMAFILVQHLDPTHESMMVGLLGGHSPLVVLQAANGMPIEREHLYIIPPGTYLSVGNGTLRLSQPQARHGARLPFDFLLNSLAEECGARAICVILSGTGADGSLGLKAIKDKGGFVVAQDPSEAGYDGMPRNAIATGSVDFVLPVAKIPQALIEYNRHKPLTLRHDDSVPPDETHDWLPGIIDLLRTKTAHDFTFYKQGTLQRRIERRVGMVGIATDNMARYLDMLRSDPNELDLLAKDLLINVTSFFRDPKVFDLLAKKIIPDLVESQPEDRPFRIWIAGCSTGEETYSLAMLFREEISAQKRSIKLQVFASDVDPDAITSAREGLYPDTIEAQVSQARLARFFSKEEHNYRVLPELRAAVVFTVQDVLADPPFSRLDLVSCRNLLIYLHPEAQAKVISLFHFALREGGILLLGSSETIGNSDGRFEVISKSERRSRPGELGLMMSPSDGARVSLLSGSGQAPSRQAVLADLCRRLVMETYAPAAVLIDHKHECLYSLGPTDRYLRVAPGPPTHDLFAMAREGLRTKLRSAIQQAGQEKACIVVAGGRTDHDGALHSFNIAVQPVLSDGEEFWLICFVDEVKQERKPGRSASAKDMTQIAALEQELEATKTELDGAIRNLEVSSEEQKAINDEALSINEEFQSTNEELLTSKEELQSLNEELTALNSQLQETLERQRTTSNDLQNVLYSTDVATLFLDINLDIRFFTPATKSLFNVIPSDVGRPLADLNSLAPDATLLTDARKVLEDLTPLEREIEAQNGAWYIRRILPYRTHENKIEGVVITFADHTERKRAANALETAKRQAELATVAKSRFLAAASHDLRQPLQVLSLMRSVLAKRIKEDKKDEALELVARLDETAAAMTGMLNTLLDINQIEAGTVHVEKVNFPINDLLVQLKDEFAYHAQAQKLILRVVPCGLFVRSDARLLDQMLRNLVANALKYTKRGKVLLGCRRHQGMLSIEIWDTGIGIPETELRTIFEEYHQLDNAARERSHGLGLGLSIVQRLGDLLGHRIGVRSLLGRGSVFTVEVPLTSKGETLPLETHRRGRDDEVAGGGARRKGTVLVVEDDPEIRDLLEHLLTDEGYSVAAAPDGVAALELAAPGMVRPDLILADYNLPKGLNGLQVSAKLQEKFHREVPVIMLTGDISTATLRDIARLNCIQLNKPVKLEELTRAIERLLPSARQPSHVPALQRAVTASALDRPVIFVVDDDALVRDTISAVLKEDGQPVESFSTCEAFLEAYRPGRCACLLIDAYLPGMSGLELLQRLRDAGDRLPAIMITGNSDVEVAVRAMKAGALDFIEKPIGSDDLLASVKRALEPAGDASGLSARQEDAKKRVAALTLRQREIMDLILAGHPNKNIAADLGISQRTVENHRAAIMIKTGTKSLPALARLALAAAGADKPHD